MNDSLLKSDVFFFITSVAVVLIALIFTISLIYLVRILRIIKRISERAEKTATMVADDVVELRNSIKEDGISPKRILNFFRGKGSKHK